MTDKEIIEAMAEAIHNALASGGWHGADTAEKSRAYKQAMAALTAYRRLEKK